MSVCGPCGNPERACSNLLAGVAIVGAVALSITVLALPIIMYIIVPIAIVAGTIALVYTLMQNTCLGQSTCGKITAVALAILMAAVLVGLYFVAPIAVPILILSTLGVAGCVWSSSNCSSRNRIN